MKQLEIIVGIVLTIALAVGVVYATGGFDAGRLNETTEVGSVIVKETFVSQSTANTMDTTEGVTKDTVTEPEMGIVNMIAGVFENVVQNVVKTSSSGGSPSSASSGSSSGGGSSGGPTTTPAATKTSSPTTDPAATPTANMTEIPEEAIPSAPILNTTPKSTPAVIEPTPTPTFDENLPGVERMRQPRVWTGPGTAGVTRTYYHIVDYEENTTSIIVESEFPAEFADMGPYTLETYIYHFANVEFLNIYRHYYTPYFGPNGEYGGGFFLSQHDRYPWRYPVVKTAMLIYSEDVGYYLISDVDFTQDVVSTNLRTGEPVVPYRIFGKSANMVFPEKQPGKPRYFDIPRSNPTRLLYEDMPNPYRPNLNPLPIDPPVDVTVYITNSGFSPSFLEIPGGTTVGWINNGTVSVQTVTSTDPENLFASGLLYPGDSFTYRFEEDITTDYITYMSETSDFNSMISLSRPPPQMPLEPAATPTPTVLPTATPNSTMPLPMPIAPTPGLTAPLPTPTASTPAPVEPTPEPITSTLTPSWATPVPTTAPSRPPNDEDEIPGPIVPSIPIQTGEIPRIDGPTPEPTPDLAPKSTLDPTPEELIIPTTLERYIPIREDLPRNE